MNSCISQCMHWSICCEHSQQLTKLLVHRMILMQFDFDRVCIVLYELHFWSYFSRMLWSMLTLLLFILQLFFLLLRKALYASRYSMSSNRWNICCGRIILNSAWAASLKWPAERSWIWCHVELHASLIGRHHRHVEDLLNQNSETAANLSGIRSCRTVVQGEQYRMNRLLFLLSSKNVRTDQHNCSYGRRSLGGRGGDMFPYFRIGEDNIPLLLVVTNLFSSFSNVAM